MMDWAFWVTVGYAILTLAYGAVCYREGHSDGINKGILLTGTAIMKFLAETKVVGQDRHGNIFRINDTGERGEVILEAEKKRA